MKRSLFFRTGVCFGLGIITAILTLGLQGCATKQQEIIVANIGTAPITLTDFEKMYLRSNGSAALTDTLTQEEKERFLDLMIKYRLKLTDAYKQEMEKRPEVLGEIDQYRGSLATSYLSERELVRPGVQRMFDRSREEIRASHILLTFPPNATAADSALVYTQAQEIINEAKAGKDFGQLALSFSKDPSVQQNKGDLYYFSIGRMVPDFEDGAFALKKGEVTPVPVKTRFGLHIIKCVDRKPSAGERQVSHIMIRFQSQTPTPEDTAAAYARIAAIQDSVNKGIPFAELAMRNSEDGGSSGRGGDLGWFGRGRWPQPFDEMAFQLPVGKVSPIVRTAYGYHLIHCLNSAPPKSFDDLKQELQNGYQQQRFQNDFAALSARIKNEVQFVRNDSVVTRFVTAFDSTKMVRDSGWAESLPKEFASATMFKVLGRTVSVDSVITMIKGHTEWWTTSLHRASLTPIVDKLADQVLYAAKSELLEKQDPEFAGLLREYKEGILLYQIEQDQVWNKIATSDSLLRVYFAQHRDKFVFPDRVAFTEIRAINEHQAKTIKEKLDAGMTMEQVAREDSIRMTAKTNYQVRFAPGKSGLTQKAAVPVGEVGVLLQKETVTRVMILAYADTSIRKAQNEALAKKRLEGVKGILTTKYGIPASRILAETRPQRFAAARQKDTAGVLNRMDLQIVGLQPLVSGVLDRAILAPAADERAKRADSLAIGGTSIPFRTKTGFSVVRKDSAAPARQKTFEEAGPEVSSAFQDYESKRLETEWLNSIKRYAPVSEHKELLKNAFAKKP